MGDGGSSVYLFINSAEDDIPVFNRGTILITEHTLEGSERITPVPYDWNNDGHKDIMTGGMDGRIKVYINKGTDLAPQFEDFFFLQLGSNIFTIGSKSAPRMHDLNKDGLMDILVGEVMGYVYFLKNTGTADNPVYTRSDKLFLKNGDALKYPGSGPRSRLDVTDWNNDGLEDIVVGGADGKVMLFLSSQDTSVSFSTLLNRTRVRSMESFYKIKHHTKTLLKTIRDMVKKKA